MGNRIEAGQRWYIKRPGAYALDKVEITEITEKTIEVLATSVGSRRERYEIEVVSFIEQVPTPAL
jgi:hypothetical protein